MAIPWRNCLASVQMINEINALFPARDRSSDGTIGDAAHAARTSDHNPWVIIIEAGKQIGIVRARDIDKDGVPIADLFEALRKLGQARDDRLWPNGYLIFNRRITKPDFSGWNVYTGTNPHDKHGHISFSTDRAGYDSTRPWDVAGLLGGGTSEDDELNADEKKMLAAIYQKVTTPLPSRVDYNLLGERAPNPPIADDMFGVSLNADARAYEARQLLLQIRDRLGTAGVDPQMVADAVMKTLGPMVQQAVAQVLGAGNTAQADEIVQLIGTRLIGETNG